VIYTIWHDIRDQEKIRKSERISKHQFQSLMHQAPVGIEIFDRDGVQIEVNHAYEKMWGLSSDLTRGKFNILESKQWTESGYGEELRQAFRGQTVCIQDFCYHPGRDLDPATGSECLWVNLKIYPLLDDKGEVGNVIVIHDDITERITTLDRLRESEEKYRDLVESTNDFVWELKKGARFTYISPQVYDLLGYRPDEMTGRTPYELMTPKERARVEKLIERITSERGNIRNFECVMNHKLGKQITIEFSGAPVYDREERYIGYRGIGRDITARKHFEDQLLMADSVFNNTIEGIAVTDRNGLIEKINPAFTEITGYTAEEVIGKNPRVLKSDRHNSQFYAEMWKSLTENSQWKGEIWNRRKDGSAYPEWLSISSIDDEEGEVKSYISLFHDITDRKNSEEKLEFLAFHDPLTRLPNRRLLYDRLNIALETAKRNHQSMALIYMDIDNFKDINDSYGHPFGDELLCTVKKLVEPVCRSSDTFARYGGDEFVIILNGINSPREVQEFSDRIINIFKDPVIIEDREIFTSLSIGMAVYPQDGTDLVTLEKNVDMALYQAKKEGKRKSYMFKNKLNEKMQRKTYLLDGLRQSMKDFSPFSMLYQPKVDIKTGTIQGVEALIRWNLNGEAVSPSEFIPLAEESNLILPLGQWIMEKAIRDIKSIHDRDLKKIFLSINLSTKQFNDVKLISTIQRILRETEFDKSNLIFEITESTSMSNHAHAMQIMSDFSQLRLQLSMDDFGTGYSSLSYLKKFPLKELKIDRSFIQDLPADSNDTAICQTIISMARNLGFQVVAEGVEKEEQLQFLKNNGCDIIQGFIFFKPLALDELTELLEKNALSRQTV